MLRDRGENRIHADLACAATQPFRRPGQDRTPPQAGRPGNPWAYDPLGRGRPRAPFFSAGTRLTRPTT